MSENGTAPLPPDLWFTPRELVARWKVSLPVIHRLCESKQLKARKVGGRWRIHRTAVARYENPGIAKPKVSTAKLDMSAFDNVEQYV